MEMITVQKSETGNARKVVKLGTKKKYRRKTNRRCVNQYTKSKINVVVEVVINQTKEEVVVIDGPMETRRKSVVTEEDKRASVSAKKIKDIITETRRITGV